MVKQDISSLGARVALEPARRELVSILARFAGSDGAHKTAIPALSIYRNSAPNQPSCALYEPVFTVVAQGAKQVVLAGEPYVYDQAHYLVTSVNLPVVSQVIQASAQEPCLCFMFALDARRIADLMAEMEPPKSQAATVERGLSVSPLSAPLLDAMLRLARLLAVPQDIPVLAPLIEREVLYRLLTAEQGPRLRHIAMTGSQTHQIARAVDWIRKNYTKPLRVEVLAQTVNMSVSSLHHHFKALTAMSPVQYQKLLRLSEARRLMLTEMRDAASAAHLVGYESPSQFSREYSRFYGAPPLRDVAQLRQGVVDGSGQVG
jgi:AraC-like DNA-binding protein